MANRLEWADVTHGLPYIAMARDYTDAYEGDESDDLVLLCGDAVALYGSKDRMVAWLTETAERVAAYEIPPAELDDDEDND